MIQQCPHTQGKSPVKYLCPCIKFNISRQYMSAIFCHGDEQMRLAKESMKAAQIDLKKEIQTVIQPAGPFYQAEE